MPGRSQGTVLQMYMVRSLVLRLTWVPCLAFSVCFLLLTEWASPVGWVPVGSDYASQRGVVNAGSVHLVGEAGRSRKFRLARPSSRRGRLEAGWRPKRVLRSERRAGVGSGRRSSLARSSGLRLDRPSGMSFRYLGRPKGCALFTALVYWAEPL